jgi:hypothetical protein
MLNDVQCIYYINVTFGCLSLNTTFWCDHQPLLSLSAPPRLSSRSDIARALPLCWSQDWQLAKPQPLQLKYPLVIKRGLENPREKWKLGKSTINSGCVHCHHAWILSEGSPQEGRLGGPNDRNCSHLHGLSPTHRLRWMCVGNVGANSWRLPNG